MVLGITGLLEDLEAEGDDTLVVTLVPRTGGDSVTVANVKIEFVSD
jgi:polyphenol oxidase